MNKSSAKHDIIVALATPYGKSALAVIRISGKGCIELANKRLKKPLSQAKMQYNVFNAESFTENLMAVCYRAPHSYSGEDTVELFTHGNMAITDGIIKVLIDDGARVAERGEFTERAFTNGKVNLMQCEALADIIDAETAEQLIYGNKRYNGGFNSLDAAEKMLNNALSTVEALLHYGDELEENEIEPALLTEVYGAIDKIIALLEEEVKGYAGGKIIKDGFKVALIGEANVGKSTLFNAMVGEDRAIVTAIAGTTRDTIDAGYVYKQKKFIIIDTAGINENTSDEVEKMGIIRAKKAAEEADAVILVTEPGKCFEPPLAEKPIVFVENKNDGISDVDEEYARCEAGGKLRISAKNRINIAALKQKLYDLCPKSPSGICNHRQYACVTRCLDCCRAAKRESGKAEGLEIVAAALFDAYSAIEQLYGEQADENIINSVFERFCVGK